MKVLTELEQLETKKDSIWNANNFIEQEETELQRFISKEEDRWFCNQGKIRVAKYQLKEYDRAKEILWEFHALIIDRIKELKTQS